MIQEAVYCRFPSFAKSKSFNVELNLDLSRVRLVL